MMSTSIGKGHPLGVSFWTLRIIGTSTEIPMLLTSCIQSMQHQLKEAHQQANDENMLQYQEWLTARQQKGLTGLFRGLKSSELAWQRPYRRIPMHERMTQRLKDWGDLWGLRPDNDPHPRPSLKAEAQTQAKHLEPLTLANSPES